MTVEARIEILTGAADAIPEGANVVIEDQGTGKRWSGVVAPAQREPEWVPEALAAIEIAKEDGDEGSPPCICDGDNVALQVLCRAFDEDPADLMEEWRAYDKSRWFWWGRALGGFMGQKIRALLAEPVGWQKCPVCGGRGEVPGDFYPQYGTLTLETQCRTCKGKGIIPIGQPTDEDQP